MCVEVLVEDREIFSEYFYSKLNFDRNFIFPTNLVPIGITFGAKSIGKMLLQSKLGLD